MAPTNSSRLHQNGQMREIFPQDLDICLGVIYCLCLVFGTPTNFISFLYFIRQKTGTGSNKSYMVYLYRMITFNDTLICFLVFPVVAVSFSNYRKPVLFSNTAFCAIWGILWNILPVLSVFLVAILSFSRSLLLVYPLKKMNIRIPAISLSVVTVIMITEKLVTHLISIRPKYQYFDYLMVCYLDTKKGDKASSNYPVAQAIIFFVVLGIPVIPVIGSFLTSVYKLRAAEKREAKLGAHVENSKHREATITVTTVTAIYILCNLPVLCYHLYFLTDLYWKRNNGADQHQSGIKPFETNRTTYLFISYARTVSYVLLVAVNSSINPIVYFTRMTQFRNFISKGKKWMTGHFRRDDSRVPNPHPKT